MEIELLGEYIPAKEAKRTSEPEPRVVTAGVAELVRRVVRPDSEDVGSSVALIAERANTSTRTVYRVLSENTGAISLDLADRLCIAADAHLAACQLFWPTPGGEGWPDGEITPYIDAEFAAVMAA